VDKRAYTCIDRASLSFESPKPLVARARKRFSSRAEDADFSAWWSSRTFLLSGTGNIKWALSG